MDHRTVMQIRKKEDAKINGKYQVLGEWEEARVLRFAGLLKWLCVEVTPQSTGRPRIHILS